MWLLGRFERLNQRAADLSSVGSEVESRNLIDAGVQSLENHRDPNGVDLTLHPDVGAAGFGNYSVSKTGSSWGS